MDKNSAVIKFLLQCPDIAASPIYFNFINAKDGDKQLVTVSEDVNVQRPYVDGSVQKRFQMTVIDYRSISDIPIVKLPTYPNENVDDFKDVQTLLDWIKEQNKAGNYPDFGNSCVIDEMYTTTDNPILDQIDTTVTPPLARYRFTITINYLQED